MKKHLLLSLLLLAKIAGAANTDSLIAVYNKSRNPDTRAELAFKIVSATLFQQPGIAIGYLQATIKDSAAIKEKKHLGKCYNAYGVYYYQQSLYDSSLFWLDKSAALFQKLKDTLEVNNALKNRGLSFTGKGDYPAAVNAYMNTLVYYRTKNDTPRIIGNLNDLGNTYLHLRNFDQAIRFQREALAFLARSPQPAMLGNVYNSIGYIFDEFKNMDSAKHYYIKSLALKEKYGSLQSVLNTRNNLCQCIDPKTENSESISCFTGLLRLQQEAEDNSGIIRSRINLAAAYNISGAHDKALHLLTTARSEAAALEDLKLLALIYRKLATTYTLKGDYRNGFMAMEQHLLYKDSVFYNERNQETLELSAKYELGKKDLELSEKSKQLLKAENEQLATDLQLKRRNQWLLLLSVLIAGGLLTGMIVAEKSRARQEKVRAAAVLQERDKGLKAIIDAQEEERIRIARELHDGVGNQLLALKMKMKGVIPREMLLQDETMEMERSLSELMDEVRNVSHQMMPKTLQEFGFVPAIRDMLDKSLGHSGMVYHFETHNVDKRYDRRLETAVFRVTQELVSNVIRHSGATEVSVQLLETANTLVLLIEDNGKGMQQDKPSDGIGMTSIRSRVTAVNGEVNILPGEHMGTVVTVRIPLTA
jgi:signal transduction histidine kinase